MFDSERQNYYQVLDVKPDATQNEIRQAYFRVKSAYAKDSAALYSLFDEQQSKDVLGRLEEAYIILSNTEKRKEYDRVHGLLDTDDISLHANKNSESNTFSFANSVDRSNIDAAHDAAHTVLGMGGSFEAFPDESHETPQMQRTSQNISQKMSQKTSQSRSLLDDDNTLAGNTWNASNPAFSESFAFQNKTPANMSTGAVNGSTQQSPSPFDVFNEKPYESRIGIVKRTSLLSTSNPSEIDTVITEETDFRGPFFRKIREMRNLSPQQLSEFTKISSNHIDNIETEAFDKLPASVYVRGFVQQIAKALKIPHDKATSGYMDNYKKTHIR